MPEPDPGLQQLAHALQIVQAHRRQPLMSDPELLAAHPALRELLEALLEPAPEVPTSAGSSAAAAPTTLGDFRLLHELGRGGMGVVYAALQLSLHRRVALKVLAGHRLASPTALVRFRREAELLAQLQHEHLVPVFASGEAAGEHFFAMELIDGCSLANVLRALVPTATAKLDGNSLTDALRRTLDDPHAGARLLTRSHAEAALLCLLPIAEALAHAHAHGVVHRDVKPANILLRRDGTPLLSDFGLARNLDTPGLTVTGDFAGTPHYVAPEQIEARSGGVDGRADVFALGATLYELLTLRRAFDGPSTEAVMARVLRTTPTPPRKLGVTLPADLTAVLDKALQKDPADRYATMQEFADDLRAVLSLRPVRAQNPGLATRVSRYARREPLRATLALLLATGVPTLLGLGGYLWVQRPRITAAAAHERRARVEALLEDAFLELGEGSAQLAVRRALAARELLPDLPETTVALVLAYERLGSPRADALRESLAAPHPTLYAELRAAVLDVQTANADLAPHRPDGASDTHQPLDALAYYVRGMRWLAFAHDSGELAAYEHAERALRAAIDRAPTARALYHCQYLHALYHLGDSDAIDAFARIVAELWPDAPVARYWVGFSLEGHRHERAFELQQQVVQARPDLGLPLASMARLHEQALRYDAAVTCYRRVLELQPDEPTALIGLARCLVHVGDAEAALRTADRAVQVAPIAHMAHLAHGYALLAFGRAEEAAADARRAIELTPRNPECHLLLANASLTSGDHGAALAAIAEAARLAPADSEPHVLATLVHDARGDAVAAAQSVEQVVAREPGRCQAWIDLTFRRLDLGDEAGSERALAAALQHGGDSAYVHLQAGNWHKRRGDATAAERHFRRAIELDPTTGAAFVNLAALRWVQGQMDECIELYRQGLLAQPELQTASEGLARALTAQGRDAEAIDERRRWAQAHPDSLVDWLRLTASLLRRGQPDDIRAALLAVERAEALAGGPRADVLYWRAEALRLRGDAAPTLRELYQQVRDRPDCSDALRADVDKRLQSLPK